MAEIKVAAIELARQSVTLEVQSVGLASETARMAKPCRETMQSVSMPALTFPNMFYNT